VRAGSIGGDASTPADLRIHVTDTAPTVPPLRIAPPPPGWRPGAAPAVDADRLARRAMIFGILSLVANMVLLPSIIGIVYGRRALRRGTALRSEAIVGVATGAVGLAITLGALLLVVLPLLLVDRGAVLQHQVEARITAGMARQGTTLTDVRCPKPDSPRAGTAIACTAQATGVGPVRIDVTFTSPTAFTGQVVRAG
jgi:hypothetical protein